MKKALGIVRNIDNLGRLYIPMEFRRVNNWNEHTPVEMYAEGDKLILQEFKPAAMVERLEKGKQALNLIETVLKNHPDIDCTNQINAVKEALGVGSE